MDIRMPLLDGVEATRLLAGPGVVDPVAVVVVTTFDLDDYVHGALAAGATGFLLKDAGPALLGEAIRAATRGDSLISPSITRRLLATFAGTGRAAPPAQPIDPLTEREEQVLLSIARGRTNAEIALELHISLSTVKTHIGSLMAKLCVAGKHKLYDYCNSRGIPHSNCGKLIVATAASQKPALETIAARAAAPDARAGSFRRVTS
jgi:DNA-binding NarL/FixJ family response regulator